MRTRIVVIIREGYFVSKLESDWNYKRYSNTDHKKGFDLIRAVNSKGLYKSIAKQFIVKGCTVCFLRAVKK